MNTATIDIGNSATKVDFWGAEGLLNRDSQGEWDVAQTVSSAKRHNVDIFIVSSVRKDTDSLVERLRKESGLAVVSFDGEEMRKWYDLSRYAGDLGPDRLAAVIGADVLYPGEAKMVVDMGTATTIDICDKEGRFRGGNISLGLFSRMKALWAATSKLPEVSSLTEGNYFGTNTTEAIQSGAINGIEGEILYSYKKGREIFGVERVVLTGGDAMKIRGEVIDEIKGTIDPYLVGRGLDHHLRTHYKI